jgi:hypothetical protein
MRLRSNRFGISANSPGELGTDEQSGTQILKLLAATDGLLDLGLIGGPITLFDHMGRALQYAIPLSVSTKSAPSPSLQSTSI